MHLCTKKEQFFEPLRLESGRILDSYELVYETYGKLNSDKTNVIVVCHALTGSHHAAGLYEGDKKAGWWDQVIGDGKVIDTSEFFVICVNTLGSCFGSTGPLSFDLKSKKQYRLKFPVITVSDMVNAQRNLFTRLGIKKAHAIIGGSLGGMQALCFGIEHSEFCENIIALATTYATQPWAIAFNKIGVEAITEDSDFKGGFYDENYIKEKGLKGLAYARMAGHISFLSPKSMQIKFGRNYVEKDGLYELYGRFEVERYLEYNAYNFAKKFDPLSYLYIIKAMNIFDTTRHYESLEDVFSRMKANLTLISFSGDLLFRPSEMRCIKEVLEKLDKKVNYYEIQSSYGHDAFLVEIEKFDKYIKKALKKE